MQKNSNHYLLIMCVSLVFGMLSGASLNAQAEYPLMPTPVSTTQSPKAKASPAPRKDASSVGNTVDERIPLVTIAGQRLLNYLANIRSAVEHSGNILNGERERISASINKDISHIQTEVIIATKVQTMAELNTRVGQLTAFWQEKQNTVTYYLGLIAGSQVQGTIERFKTIESKFDTLFDRIKPTPELQTLKDEFSTEIKAAESAATQARELFAKIQAPGDHIQEFKDGLAAFKQAHAHLKEARRLSRELISLMRAFLSIPSQQPTSTPTIQP